MATFIALLIPVTIQHNAMWKQPITLRQRKLFERKFVCFVVCFVVVFLVLFFFGGAGGWGWVCFVYVFFGGGGWNTTQRDVNAIHRTSECYSWQRKFDRRWFVCFVFLLVCFFWFLFYFYYFFGGGGWLSFFGGGGQGIDYPNYALSTVSQKILAQFRFRFVLLFVVV